MLGMRHIVLFFGLISFTVLTVSAQKKYVFTVQEAITHALENVNDIKNLKIDKQMQLAKNHEITGQALPQINGTVSVQRYFKIPVTLLPDFISPQVYGVLEEQGVRDGNGAPIVKPTTPPQFFPAQFGVPWQASAGTHIWQIQAGY